MPQVACPTLVVHYVGDKVVPFTGGRDLAKGIPGARFVPLEGQFHLPDLHALDHVVEHTHRLAQYAAG